MKNILIVGASRGLGDALSQGLPQAGDTAWLVSRGKPHLMQQDAVNRIWIEADLSSNTASQQIVAALDGQRVDALVYNVGIWESTAFSDDYDFEGINLVDHERIQQQGWKFYSFIGVGGARFVCSWNTTTERIDELVRDVQTAG